jgi:hypothetical protein
VVARLVTSLLLVMVLATLQHCMHALVCMPGCPPVPSTLCPRLTPTLCCMVCACARTRLQSRLPSGAAMIDSGVGSGTAVAPTWDWVPGM